jgi:hypothetical protein
MRHPTQNVLANQSGYRLLSSKRNSARWMKDWPRYGTPLALGLALLLTSYQRLGNQPCATAHPQGFRKPNLDTESSTLRIPCFVAQLRHIYAILWAPTDLTHVRRDTTSTNSGCACRTETRHRCRLACISPTLPDCVGLLLQPHRVEAPQRSIARGRSAPICGRRLRRQRV